MADRLEWDWGGLAAVCRAEVRRVVRDAPDAEDAVQEALARAWRGRASCRTPEHPAPWMRAIARNEALRVVGARRPLSLLDEDVQTAARESAADMTDGVAQRVDVRTALDALPPEDRVLVALRYEEDLTQPRIATLLGLPEGTVKVRLHRIRSRLIPALSDSL